MIVYGIEVPDNVYMVGLGHRARHGKDFTAELMSGMYENVMIIHWAEELYKECRNVSRKFPLVVRLDVGKYAMLSHMEGDFPRYKIVNKTTLPSVHRFMTDNDITTYYGMDDKDPIFLQLWGTDYRRALFDDLYWVKLTMKSVAKNVSVFGDSNVLVLIPDTRFMNEYKTIRDYGIYYIDVKRYNDDGSLFIAPDRDADHPSEASLDILEDDDCDLVIRAKYGEHDKLKVGAQQAISDIIRIIEEKKYKPSEVA